MTGPNPKNRSLVLAEVQEQPYASRFTDEEIDRALTSAVEMFSDVEHKFVLGSYSVLLRPKGVFRPTSFAQKLVPGFLYAHRFFGDILPTGLKQKLTNQPQTHDTLFELMCLGAFHQDHNVRYEPTLADGKTPDLMLSLSAGQDVYVECKSQSLMGLKHQRLFTKAADHIHKIIDDSTFVKNAWANGLRSEVRLSQSPSDADISELQQTIDEHEPNPEGTPIAFGNAITLSLIPRDQPFDQSQSSPLAVMQVGTTATQMHHKNVPVAVYPWRRLDTIRRKSQRRLLKSARLQLTALPPCDYGLICIQTHSSKKFAADILELLRQKEFEKIPIVWMNPLGASLVISRDDALTLRNEIFGKNLQIAKKNADQLLSGMG